MKPITLQCIFWKALKSKDGGWQLTLALDATQAHALLEVTKLDNDLLNVAIVPEGYQCEAVE